ncbi:MULTISPECIES: ATP-binding cassette domain-containing protein [Clostridia]|uniref:ABC transporter ATP-binding protein n=1 Tax=Clostridia TaxID=186801 RepID=UPI000EA250A6|nr:MULTISPECIES: ATP-binding cassette domain-containing protein [Clostridia]NBJ69531.1 ATP-binding cassette domain-containing protein [Roseburia sp. 1XD42-34]RKI78603.1 ATP-binding cassette domain-containing protein [Clostridium sp. 1xD42-85]
MILIKDVSYHVDGKSILKKVNLKLNKGKVYGILGPNGAGKTTLFKALLGAIKYEGEILDDDHTLVGKLIEYPAFYPNLSCFENLKLHASYAQLDDWQRNIDSLLKLVGIFHVKNKKFKSLSMGMKQRLGVAKALMGNPNTLLLDEPTNGLDPMGIKEMRNLVEKEIRNKNRIVMISSHNLNEISHITDTIIFINNGEIILEIENEDDTYIIGKVREISNEQKEEEITLLTNDKNENIVVLSRKKFEAMSQNNTIFMEDIQYVDLENLYIELMSLGITEVKTV